MDTKQNPWNNVQNNIREFVKAWKASHESVFTIHWKTFPPFKWFFPQVDYIRIQKLMDTTMEHISIQIPQITTLLKQCDQAQIKNYYQASVEYLKTLEISCLGLKEIAALKHAKLAGNRPKFKETNEVLKTYQDSLAKLYENSNKARLAWNNLDSEIR